MRKVVALLSFAIGLLGAREVRAQPVVLPFEGFLTGLDDLPVSGMFDVEVRIWDAAEGGTAVFQEGHQALLTGGYFSIGLGSGTSLDPALFQGGAQRWLGVTIVGDGAELRPRFSIGFVPYALHALSAQTSGPVGPTGAQGPAGPAGPAGPQGAVGAAGPRGPTGPNGAQGLTGPAGPIGAQGAIGPAGPQGTTGAQGGQGATGAQGPQGQPGATGSQGLQGLQGLTGAQGPQGIAGPAGNDGAPGAPGPRGLAGPPGPAGVPCADCVDDASIIDRVVRIPMDCHAGPGGAGVSAVAWVLVNAGSDIVCDVELPTDRVGTPTLRVLFTGPVAVAMTVTTDMFPLVIGSIPAATTRTDNPVMSTSIQSLDAPVPNTVGATGLKVHITVPQGGRGMLIYTVFLEYTATR